MGVEASPEPQAAAAAALEAAALSPEPATELLGAPQGWHKKLAHKKGGTPKRRDVVFIAPSGEEIRSKAHLERYLKANPGGPQLTDFDWSTGGTPRRSERLSTKTRKSTDSTEADVPNKRSKKKTPAKDSQEHEETEINPSENDTPVKESKEDEEKGTKLSETNEDENNDSKQPEEPAPVKELKEDEGTGTKSSETKEEETMDCKQSEEPAPVKEVKEVEDTENKLSLDEPVQDSKEGESVETDQVKVELPVKIAKEDPDTEMEDATPVTENLEVTAVVVKEDLKLTVSSTVEVKGVNGDLKLEQNVELETPMVVESKEVVKGLEFTESKKDAILDGQQDAINGSFSAAEPYRQDEHVEHSESEHEKPEITSYFGVTKPQEAHPAEVGVSS
ncbi:hypothetical protein O6H91_01G167800 [Diphasiastrum complanatum]|uniref:Uncharacterized protein n=1 Tax=Diphasiastrum complanatum TaxID=34168 RepID=A0ACC2EYM7_DIPCM|nr:hypothetical protein O6H91_Y373400 [Diphasiastrum complanatum]KAJ7571594.1 hypothetical protein O6H91_01G167800 [Diphasiastrum complanatum]